MSFILLLSGFFLLVKGADLFVEGSASIAKRLHIPVMIIGLTIVAIGTSLPETAVSVSASLAGNNELAIGNVIGSNIFNLMIVTGCSALFVPLTVSAAVLKREFPFSVAIAGILLLLGVTGMTLSRSDGVILLLLFAAFLIWMIRSAKSAHDSYIESETEVRSLSAAKSLFFLLAGGCSIAVGGQFVVRSAAEIAGVLGMSQNLIGLTITALGTSLPELFTSIAAARKGEYDLALGNVIGSNIFNIVFVLGMAAVIHPIGFIDENIIDLLILIGMSSMVWVLSWTNRKIFRGEGILMLLLYTIFLGYIILR